MQIDVEFYDFIYTFRQVQNFRKFELIRFRRRQKHELVKLFGSDQRQTFRSLIIKYEAPLKVKEIVDSTNLEQQQYFRAAKKIKSSFVAKLKEEG